jgi:hypothetical protein
LGALDTLRNHADNDHIFVLYTIANMSKYGMEGGGGEEEGGGGMRYEEEGRREGRKGRRGREEGGGGRVEDGTEGKNRKWKGGPKIILLKPKNSTRVRKNILGRGADVQNNTFPRV